MIKSGSRGEKRSQVPGPRHGGAAATSAGAAGTPSLKDDGFLNSATTLGRTVSITVEASQALQRHLLRIDLVAEIRDQRSKRKVVSDTATTATTTTNDTSNTNTTNRRKLPKSRSRPAVHSPPRATLASNPQLAPGKHHHFPNERLATSERIARDPLQSLAAGCSPKRRLVRRKHKRTVAEASLLSTETLPDLQVPLPKASKSTRARSSFSQEPDSQMQDKSDNQDVIDLTDDLEYDNTEQELKMDMLNQSHAQGSHPLNQSTSTNAPINMNVRTNTKKRTTYEQQRAYIQQQQQQQRRQQRRQQLQEQQLKHQRRQKQQQQQRLMANHRPDYQYAKKKSRNIRSITAEEIAPSITDDATGVIYIMNRRVNMNNLQRGASTYSLLRAWVEDDPYRQRTHWDLNDDVVTPPRRSTPPASTQRNSNATNSSATVKCQQRQQSQASKRSEPEKSDRQATSRTNHNPVNLTADMVQRAKAAKRSYLQSRAWKRQQARENLKRLGVRLQR